jgi:hypothetical protein
VAGSRGREIFLADCFDVIYRYTGGIPRLINTLCDTSMLAASNDSRDQVSVDDVRAAIGELQWNEYSSRTGTRLLRLRPDGTPGEPTASTAGTANGELGTAYGRLLVATDGHTVGAHLLYAGRLIVGRTAANDLQIDSRFVSRHHCQIITTPQSCVVEDLNSTNGIYVHGKRVRYHNLNDGDVVTIGQHELLYIDERSVARAASEEPAASAAVEHGATTVLGDHPLETHS